MTTAISPTQSVTSGANPLEVNGNIDPSKIDQRRINAEVNGDQVSSNVANQGNGKIFQDANKRLGKQDFLTLLVTQLRYQDPLSPEANTEFVAQLAQFSNLEGTQNINSSIEDLGKKFDSMVSTQSTSASAMSSASATSLIGKSVRVNAKDLAVDGTPKKIYDLKAHATKGLGALVSIVDDKEQIINVIDVEKKLDANGDVQVTWNGLGMDGKTVPAGNYHLRVTSKSGADTGYAFYEGPVSGVNYSKDGMKLEINGQSVSMDQILHIGDAEKPNGTTSNSQTASAN